MSIVIKEMKPEDLELVAQNPVDKMPPVMIDRGPYAWSVFVNDTLFGCYGAMLYPWKTVAEAWVAFRDVDFLPNIKVAVIRRIIRHMKEFIKENNILRMNALVRTDFEKAVSFVETAGFQREGLLRKYGPEGIDCYVYGLVP